MTHEMVITLGQPTGDGLTARLVCTEAEGAARGCRNDPDDPTTCNLVEAFCWDATASMEDYCGKPLELMRAPISVHGVDETHFDWELAAPEPAVSEEER